LKAIECPSSANASPTTNLNDRGSGTPNVSQSTGSPVSIMRRFDSNNSNNSSAAGGRIGAHHHHHQKSSSFGKVADPIWIDDDCKVDDDFCFSDDGLTPDKSLRRRKSLQQTNMNTNTENKFNKITSVEIENEQKMAQGLWDKPSASSLDLLHITSRVPLVVNRTGKAAPKKPPSPAKKQTTTTKTTKKETRTKSTQKWFYTKVTFVAVLLNFVVALPASIFTQLPTVFTGLGVLKALDWLFPNSRNRLIRISKRFRSMRSGFDKNRKNISFPRLKFARINVQSIANIARRGSVNAMNRVSAARTPLKLSESFDNLIKEGQKKDLEGDTLAAVEIFTKAVDRQPLNQFANIALSKSLSDRVFEPAIFKDRMKAKAIADESVGRARKAVEMDPSCCHAHVCLAVAYGRAQMFSNENREKVELGRMLKDSLDVALAINPDDDMALHVLGRYEWSMANLSGLTKVYVKMMYGALVPGSAANAEKCFKRCIEINPERLIHKVELAKMLFDLKRFEEALSFAKQGSLLAMEDVNSEIERKNALEIIRKSELKLLKRSRSSALLSNKSKSRTFSSSSFSQKE